jgi:GTP-binding protein HflX
MTDTTGTHAQRPGRRLTATVTDLEVERQRALLVGVARSKNDEPEAEKSLAELELLTDTAGSEAVDTALVRRGRPDPATFIGSGKLSELVSVGKALDIDLVVFDNELSPAQQRNLQKAFETDVVDRIALILDIFAQHAHTKEGMIQVELAQHRYRLPRLRGMGTELSRLGAGIGTRGPGETKLETDRRRILDRIAKLEDELEQTEKSRATRSKSRRRSGLPIIALVGYTNAGKSTLFNQLSDAGVLVEDRLFATLDSTIRKIELPEHHEVLISDTVGFVRRLPHELIEAFRSTLEEVADADLLFHLVDAADDDPDRQIEVVRSVLDEIGAGDIPEVLVFNKEDIADPVAIRRLGALYQGSVAISALTGEGTADLLGAATRALAADSVELELFLPYDRGDLVALLHDRGDVMKETHEAEGTRVIARVPSEIAPSVHEFQVTG